MTVPAYDHHNDIGVVSHSHPLTYTTTFSEVNKGVECIVQININWREKLRYRVAVWFMRLATWLMEWDFSIEETIDGD